jgi:NAD(P)-dependent dehydrogenase (short-subunit alcohol dehydrogenase family)
VRVVALDVTDAAAASRAVKDAVNTFGRLDVLVNNVGYGEVGSIEDTRLEDSRAQIETNLFGVIHLTKATIPAMRQQRSGRIIQFSSIGGRLGAPGRGAYAAAKSAVEGKWRDLVFPLILRRPAERRLTLGSVNRPACC